MPLLVPGALVVLTGVGGGGKTRLAVRAATLASSHFAEGVWFVELAAVRDPAAVASHVAAVLEVSVTAGVSPSAALAGWVGSRAVLLVVDNCEHVLDAAAALVEGLRDRCPHLGVLATSREDLAVDGERIMAVAPLDSAASVELFCDRSGLSAAALADDRRRAIVELCGHLDGLPLALELAAARTRSLPPEEIGRRLGERFRLLGGSKRAHSDRHRTLRTAIDWSFQLLDGEEQDLFCRLAVFAGRFGLEAVEAIVDGSVTGELDVIDVVDRLVDKSMVVADTSGPRPLYALLESLRDYGSERLVDGDQVRRAHAEFHGRLVRRLVHQLRTEDEADALNELDGSWADIRAAVIWAADAGEISTAVELVRGLGFETFYRLRTEVGDWTERVLTLREIASNPHISELAATAALAATMRGDLELANARLALCHRERRADAVTLEAGFASGVVHMWSGRPEEAYRSADEIEAASDVPPSLAKALGRVPPRHRGQLSRG